MQIEPGKYQMRNGEQAMVLWKNPADSRPIDHYWIGVAGEGEVRTWCEDGRYTDDYEYEFDLIAPWPAPVVRDLVIVKRGSLGMCAVGVGYHMQDIESRFRLTWNPAQPDVLGWERVK